MIDKKVIYKWKQVKLTEVIEINPKLIKNSLDDTMEVSFIPMAAVSESGKLLWQETKKVADVKTGYTYFEENDILFAKITPCMENGKRAIVAGLMNGVGFGSTEFHVLRTRNDIAPEYLYYIISDYKFRREAKKNMTGTAGQKRVPTSFLHNYNILLPPLDLQKKIVAVLDKAQSLIDIRLKQIGKLDEFLQNVFLKVFGEPEKNPKGWPTDILEKLSDIVSGVTKGRKIKGSNLQLIPYMRVANVQDGRLDLSEIKEIYANDNEIKNYRLFHGDLLLTEGGDPDKLGRCAIWKEEISVCIHQNHIFRVRVDEKYIKPEYLCFLLGSSYGKKYFLKAAKQTTGIATINSKQLKHFPVLIPSISLQNKFAQIVENVERQKELLQKSLAEMETLFQSIMQKAFRGELFQ